MDHDNPQSPPDATVEIPRGALLPRPSAEPGPTAPPPPPPRPVNDPRSGLGWVWVGVTVVVVGLFVVAAYFVVARAEEDRPTGRGGPTPTEPSGPTTTEAPTSTAPPPTTHDPATVAVVVLNGTGQRGWAGENVDRLAGAAFADATAADAAAEAETTTVHVAEGFEADGAAVAAAIGLPDAPVEPKPADSLAADGSVDAEAPVVVVLGADSLG